jgi:hypothetical protein
MRWIVILNAQKFIMDSMKDTKMKSIKLLIYILLNSSLWVFAAAQPQRYPNLSNLLIRSGVTFERSEQMYFYSYSMMNSKTSSGKIDELEIDISKPHSSIEMDTIGLRFENDDFTEGSFRRNFPHLKGRIVPIGFTRSPERWTASLSNNLTATFFTTRSYAIPPGQEVGGFEIMSKGLPAIRRCISSPFFDVVALFPDPNDTSVNYYVPPVDSVRKTVRWYGWTVGPMAPPEEFSATAWLDSLLSYVHQSHELGWINNTRDDDAEADERAEDGIVKNLDKRLMQTRDLIVKDKIGAAKGRLTMFLNKVERLWDRQQKEDKRNRRNPKIIFTSEAYALLKYNGEYLLDHLTEPKEGKDGKDKGREEKKGREK